MSQTPLVLWVKGAHPDTGCSVEARLPAAVHGCCQVSRRHLTAGSRLPIKLCPPIPGLSLNKDFNTSFGIQRIPKVLAGHEESWELKSYFFSSSEVPGWAAEGKPYSPWVKRAVSVSPVPVVVCGKYIWYRMNKRMRENGFVKCFLPCKLIGRSLVAWSVESRHVRKE